MKIKNIRYIHDWDFMDPENDNIDVFIEVENVDTYVLTVATPKNVEYLMEKYGINYSDPGYPFLLVKRLTEEIIAEAIHAHAEDDGYWIKLYHFAGKIKENMFQ